MRSRTLSLTIAGATSLILLTAGAIAGATSCPPWVSEERSFAVASITQLDGTGDHAAAERARWSGKTQVTLASTPDDPALDLWLRVHIEDGPVRNVRILTASYGTDDTGAPGDTGARGGAR